MTPQQLEAHCLAEIARFESLIELVRTQQGPPGEAVRSALEKVAYNCSLASEPLKPEEVDDGVADGISR